MPDCPSIKYSVNISIAVTELHPVLQLIIISSKIRWLYSAKQVFYEIISDSDPRRLSAKYLLPAPVGLLHVYAYICAVVPAL